MRSKINVKDQLDDDVLDLSFCDLQEVPIREIIPIKKASGLDLSNNQLTSIPNTIVTLTNIVKLNLSKNMLTEIPVNIGEMRQLRYLDLYSNQISRLPLSMGDLKNLKWLDLKENPLTPAVASVAGMCSNNIECQNCARNIVAYLSNVKREIEEERLRRIKATNTSNNNNDTVIKKESKKKKKKKNTDKGEMNIKDVSSTLNSKNFFSVNQVDKTEQSKKKHLKATKSFGGKLCSIFSSIIYSISLLLIVLGIIIPLFIVSLPKFDQILSNNVVTFLELQTKLPIKNYQQIGIQTMDSIIHNILMIFDRFKLLLIQHYENIINNF